MRWIALLVSALLFAGGFAAANAWAADDFLDSSDPAPRQELKQVPGWVTLVFKAQADASLATIIVLDSAGRNVTTGPLIVEGTNVTTQLMSGLPKGTYTVYYRTTDEFGERRGGAYQFAYGKGDWTPVESEVWKGESAQPTILNDPEPTDSPTPTPTPTAPETFTPSPTTAPPASPTAAPTATPQPADPGDSTGWILGGGAVILGVAGVAGWLAWRRRRGEQG
ncbi:MAG: copper resistance protein CopC [Propionicimonas sp.]